MRLIRLSLYDDFFFGDGYINTNVFKIGGMKPREELYRKLIGQT